MRIGTVFAAAIVLTLLAASCRQSGLGVPDVLPDMVGDTQAPDTSGLALPTPPLHPAAPVQPRAGSESGLVVDNTFVFADSGGASGPGAGVSFDIVPSATAAGWAVYRVPLAVDARPHTWNLNLDGDVGGGPLRWWIAAYSFSDQRWQWIGEYAGMTARARAYDAHDDDSPVQVYLNDTYLRSRFVNAGGGGGVEAYFAIVVEPASQGGGASLNVAGSLLESFELGDPGYLPVEPLPVSITGVSANVGAGTLTLDLASGGDADGILIQRRERVSGTSSFKAPNAANPWEDLGILLGGATQFVDPTDGTPPATPPVADTPYEYRAQAINQDGTTTLSSLPSASQILTLAANQPPVARLYYPGSADISEDVTLDASQSSDSDGTVTDYEWDFDGNGTFNEAINGEDVARGLAIVVTRFEGGALVYPVVRVYDNGGSTNTATGSSGMAVHGWVMTPIEDRSGGACLLQVNGRPAIGYVHQDDLKIRYAYAPNSTGVNGGLWQLVDVGSVTGDYLMGPHMEVVSGNPAVAYVGADRTLFYSRAGNADGTGWGAPVEVAPAGQLPIAPRLAIIAGKPALSFTNLNNGDLNYAHSSSATGGAGGDWQTTLVDPDFNQGNEAPLAEVDGCPALAYGRWENGGGGVGSLRYARSSTPSGASTADWSIITVEQVTAGIPYARNSALTVIAGNPAIAFKDNTSHIRYIRAGNSTGATPGDWPASIVMSDLKRAGDNLRLGLVILNGTPVIGYANENYQPQFDKASTPGGTGSGDWSQYSLIPLSQGMDQPSTAIINGHLAVAYMDLSNGNLHMLTYAILL